MKNSLALALLWAAVPVVIASAQTSPAVAVPVPPVGGVAGGPAQVPDKWTTKTYRFVADDLNRGFVSREKGQLRAPAMPKANASPAELVDFLRKSDMAALQYLKSQGIVLPEGSLAVYDPRNQTLVMRTSNRGHEQVDLFSRDLLFQQPTTLNFVTYLIEADATVVRQMLVETAGKGDHSAQLARLRALVGEGKARQVNFVRIETKSGQRAAAHSGKEALFSRAIEGSRDAIASVESDMEEVGSKIEIDPVLGPDGKTIDINFSLRHHYRAPTDRWESIGQAPSGTRTDIRIKDWYTVETNTAQTLMSGSARLMGVWKPEGTGEPERENKLLVAILRADVVKILRAEDDRLQKLVAAHGETIRPTPATVPAEFKDPTMPNGMIIRRFRISPSFLSSGASRDRDSGGATSADPFAAAPPSDEMRLTIRATALDILRAQGIEFPKGSSANFITATNELIVRNTPENVAQVEAFVDSLTKTRPLNVSFRIHVVQADGAFLRKLEEEHASRADHAAMWKSVTDAATQGQAKLLHTMWVGSRSGQRVATHVGREYHYVTEAGPISGSQAVAKSPQASAEGNKGGNAALTPASTPSSPVVVQDNSAVSATTEMRVVGFRFELDPVIAPDGEMIDLNLATDYHYAPPSLRGSEAGEEAKVMKIDGPETNFHQSNTTTAITTLSGTMRLIGLWKPEGTPEFEKADIMQAVFIQSDIDPVEE
ncbi:MAG: hypothetical protein ACAI34_08320 [Verrucomicrobium sp.]